jgi:hypothetical protein
MPPVAPAPLPALDEEDVDKKSLGSPHQAADRSQRSLPKLHADAENANTHSAAW